MLSASACPEGCASTTELRTIWLRSRFGTPVRAFHEPFLKLFRRRLLRIALLHSHQQMDLTRPARFELATSRSGGERSIH
jgi:hypothetical protein